VAIPPIYLGSLTVNSPGDGFGVGTEVGFAEGAVLGMAVGDAVGKSVCFMLLVQLRENDPTVPFHLGTCCGYWKTAVPLCAASSGDAVGDPNKCVESGRSSKSNSVWNTLAYFPGTHLLPDLTRETIGHR
jgi:hypothetical protein